VYGADYLTKDGTCIRDHIHLDDITYIYQLCIEYLTKNNSTIFNWGYKKGYSVKRIIDRYEKIYKIKINKLFLCRRGGDSAKTVCDNLKLRKNLNGKQNIIT